MIPYLLLSAPLKKRMQRVVKEYLTDPDEALGVITTLEEYGDEEPEVRRILTAVEERTGATGLTTAVLSNLEGQSTSSSDWRTLPRRSLRRRKK
jgi:hypothetical protein